LRLKISPKTRPSKLTQRPVPKLPIQWRLIHSPETPLSKTALLRIRPCMTRPLASGALHVKPLLPQVTSGLMPGGIRTPVSLHGPGSRPVGLFIPIIPLLHSSLAPAQTVLRGRFAIEAGPSLPKLSLLHGGLLGSRSIDITLSAHASDVSPRALLILKGIGVSFNQLIDLLKILCFIRLVDAFDPSLHVLRRILHLCSPGFGCRGLIFSVKHRTPGDHSRRRQKNHCAFHGFALSTKG